ncbi:hypothetical protein [Pseudarthrobacter sp. MEB009]|uniref:hypothetical protein n=1 Tax=Pseudarthrobacter sp. MEB009 TaxID=3040326 RepID=UPI002554EC01|nr:hypothetical protein [Pseudarthrobacter sp. MEB009]
MTAAAVLEKDWKTSALDEIEALAKTGTTFTADTLRARGIVEPPHHNQWGSVFGTASRRGLIAKADYSSSRRKSRHGGFLHAWRGVPDAGN